MDQDWESRPPFDDIPCELSNQDLETFQDIVYGNQVANSCLEPMENRPPDAQENTANATNNFSHNYYGLQNYMKTLDKAEVNPLATEQLDNSNSKSVQSGLNIYLKPVQQENVANVQDNTHLLSPENCRLQDEINPMNNSTLLTPVTNNCLETIDTKSPVTVQPGEVVPYNYKSFTPEYNLQSPLPLLNNAEYLLPAPNINSMSNAESLQAKVHNSLDQIHAKSPISLQQEDVAGSQYYGHSNNATLLPQINNNCLDPMDVIPRVSPEYYETSGAMSVSPLTKQESQQGSYQHENYSVPSGNQVENNGSHQYQNCSKSAPAQQPNYYQERDAWQTQTTTMRNFEDYLRYYVEHTQPLIHRERRENSPRSYNEIQEEMRARLYAAQAFPSAHSYCKPPDEIQQEINVGQPSLSKVNPSAPSNCDYLEPSTTDKPKAKRIRLKKKMTRTPDVYRVCYTDKQRDGLEGFFKNKCYITVREKEEIAKALDLSERQVKIWFQNRRAVIRRKVSKSEVMENLEQQQKQIARRNEDEMILHWSTEHEKMLRTK